MTEEKDNVIKLTPRLHPKGGKEMPPIVRKRASKRSFCPHTNTELDYNARSIECCDCKAVLDPYQVLQNLMYYSDYTHAREERNALLTQCEELKKLRQRLRGDVYRLQRRTKA